MKGFNLPALRVPIHLFNGRFQVFYRQIGQQFPADRLVPGRFVTFPGVNHGQRQLRILLVFTNGRMHRHPAVPQLQLDRNRLAMRVQHFHAQRALNRLAFHLFRDRSGSSPG